MAAYLIVDLLAVTDADGFGQYRQRVGATVEKYGGKYLVAGGKFEKVEGAWQPGGLVLLEFPNMERAKSWYNSEDYRELKALRQRSANANMVLVEGI